MTAPSTWLRFGWVHSAMWHSALLIFDVIRLIVWWLVVLVIFATLAITIAGELLGHAPLRRFLLWVRGP